MSNDMPSRIEYTIGGRRFDNFAGFCAEFTRVVLAAFDMTWNGNLDSFNDFLSWPADGGQWSLVWENADLSRRALGHEAMVHKLEETLASAHPSNHPDLRRRLALARAHSGPTLFDELVEIIEGNKDSVALRLQ